MEPLVRKSGSIPRRSSHRKPRARAAGAGLGQLTLVEHALCPLDARSSLVRNLVFDTQFVFTDAQRHTQRAVVRVFCPLGLSAGDEFFLWGLLALTWAQSGTDGNFMATPHYVLRRLGLIDQHSRRGGRQYRQFAAAIERLSAVTYQSDKFYDPIRGEHRRVSFGFLSYSLPLDDASERAWRIVWDPVFFEFTKALGGHLWFDLATYRELDAASRRLFLFLCKVFARRQTSPRMPLRHLGENVLGFADSLVTRDLKLKVARCVTRLAKHGVVAGTGTAFEKQGRGEYFVTLQRGACFERPRPSRAPDSWRDSALLGPLCAIGLDEKTIRRLVRQFPARLLQEWADITLAAKERFGATFFKRSPQAYFIDNVRHAAKGGRTPPDWWHALRKSEQRQRGESEHGLLARIREGVSAKLADSGAGKSPAPGDAERKGEKHRRTGQESPRPERIGSILSLPKHRA